MLSESEQAGSEIVFKHLHFQRDHEKGFKGKVEKNTSIKYVIH